MTMLDERLRRVGEELDRAAVAYAARSTERPYVTPPAPRPLRPRLVVAVVALLALLVGAGLAVRAARSDDRTMADSPEGRAVARNLGDMWLWPNEGSDIPAGTPEEITREFATRVLGLTGFTVVREAPDPRGMRIDTPTMSLSLLTTRVPGSGSADRWVVYELKSSELSLNETGLVVTGPPGTASLDLFVRDAGGGHAASLDNPIFADNPVVFAHSDAIVSALVVFRDVRGDVIDAASIDAQTVTPQSLVTCTFEFIGEVTTALLHAAMGDSASANIGVYTAHVEIVEGRSARGPSLRVSLSGPPGTSYEAEGDLSRTRSAGYSSVLSGDTNVGGGRLTFSCIAEKAGSR